MGLTIDELAMLAAEWWADRIENTKFDADDKRGKVKWLPTLTRLSAKHISEETRIRFIYSLSEIIRQELHSSPENTMVLEVDYLPDERLFKAAEITGVSINNFPWKATMWIREDHVSVKYGYRGHEQFLYANKAFWRRKIDFCQDCIRQYEDGSIFFWMEDKKEKRLITKEYTASFENEIKKYKASLAAAEE